MRSLIGFFLLMNLFKFLLISNLRNAGKSKIFNKGFILNFIVDKIFAP